MWALLQASLGSNPGSASYQYWTEGIFLSEIGNRNRTASQGGSKD